MKIRSLRPEFFSDRKMAALTAHARLLYAALWCIADDEGRGRYLPKQIEGEAFPHEAVDVAALLGELAGADRIRVYEYDGEQYFHIPAFGRHQHPNRQVESRLPVPPVREQCIGSVDAAREQREGSTDAPPVVEEVEVDEGVEVVTPPSTDVDVRADPTYRFDDFWDSYPKRRGRRVDKAKAVEAWRRLGYDDKAAAFRGVKHYRADCDRGDTLAKDAFRWLRDRCWEDWQDEADPSRSLSKQERRIVDRGHVEGFLEAVNGNGIPRAITTGSP